MNGGIAATIATSIMPKRIEVQQSAIKTWQQLGFKVLSVNVESELAILPHLFHGVDFLPARQKSRTSPLISISELLETLAKCNSNLCGIVNSDVILWGHDDFISFLLENTKDNALIFGSRIDVDDIDSRSGTPYGMGYDYFFFRKEVLHLPLIGNFFLGAPWWDYWFPISLAINGIKLQHLVVPVGYHLKHDQGWDDSDLESGRRKFISAISEMLIKPDKISDLSDRFRSIINTQGMESFASQIPLILLLDSELVVHGPQSVPFENLSVIVDILNIHRESYEAVLGSRSWRWTAPVRFLSSHFRAFIGKLNSRRSYKRFKP